MQMEESFRSTLPFRKGYLALSDTHVLVVRDDTVTERLALKHLSHVAVEQAQSFRYRTIGFIVGLLLLVPVFTLLIPADIAANLAVLAMLRGRVAVGVFFCGFFGVLFLWGALTSRRIWWLRLRYAGVPKLLPLPNVEEEALVQFAGLLAEADQSHRE
jgi:hypothetical protein